MKLDRATKSFELLKEKMTDTPVLKHFDSKLQVEIIVYANEWAIGATLAQMYDGMLHPVRFTGRVLKSTELKYHDADKVVLALLRALKEYFYLLRGRPVTVYTRYSVMKWLFNGRSCAGSADEEIGSYTKSSGGGKALVGSDRAPSRGSRIDVSPGGCEKWKDGESV